MIELLQILLPSILSLVIGSWAGWFFGRKRQNIDNIDAAIDTWQKVVDALEERVAKEMAGKICAEEKIDALTIEVRQLKEEIEELKEAQKQFKKLENKIRKYEKLLIDNDINF